MEPKKEIPIFFTIDESYAPYLDVALHSLITNASKNKKYKIIILHEELSKQSQDRIMAQSCEYVEIVFVEMKNKLQFITDRVENRLRCDYFTLTIYFRLFIAEMYPEYEKGIYIDSDIIVLGDISELYNVELGSCLIGACRDYSVQGIPEICTYMQETIGIKRTEYINSGVLLLNCKEFRKAEFAKRFLELMNQYHFDCIAPDQDYLNAMCNGRIKYLEECWDAMPIREREPLKEPKLIHYNLFDKPWCYDHISYEAFFWKYAEKSAFYQDILEFKRNYSDEQKESDRQCLEELIHKAGKSGENRFTFKKVMESGEKIRL